MTFARIKQTGVGKLDYRIEIAGWPHEWTTSSRITYATGRDSRELFPGLQYTGLKISEKAILKDCWTQQGQLSVKIKPTSTREETVESFTRTAVTIAYLAQHDAVPGLDFDSTAWTLDGASALPVGFYHLASECIHLEEDGSITRARWQTTAQRHYIAYGTTSAISVPIYAYPPTMEGRRAVLFVYGAGDDVAGPGTAIWRGIVARPPALDNDGITWTIQIDPIIKTLDQNVAASESLEYHIRGIYHSSNSPLRISYYHTGAGYTHSSGPEFAYVTGFFQADSDVETAVNTKLVALITARSAAITPDTSEIATATYYTSRYGNGFPVLECQTNTTIAATVGDLLSAGHNGFFAGFSVESYLEGYCSQEIGSTQQTAQPGLVGSSIFFGNHVLGASDQLIESFGDGSHAYATPLGKDLPYTPIFSYPLSTARAMLGSVPTMGSPPIFNDTLSPADRVYLDLVDGIEVSDHMIVKNGDNSATIQVTGVDLDSKWITATIASGDPVVWFDSKTKIVPIRTIAINAGLPEFLQGLVDESVNANDGDSPYTPQGDINVDRFASAFSSAMIDDYWKHRNYAFLKPTPIKRIVQEELKAIGWMTRVEATGDIGCTPLPIIGNNQAASAITDADILLPARGQTGGWVTWQAQADGLVNNVNVRLGYNPNTDEYDTKYDFSVRDISSIAEHKTNGTKAAAAIAPVSTQNRPTIGRLGISIAGVTSLNIDITYGPTPSPTTVATWVQNYLRVLSMDYATVTIQVPWKFFDLLVGDLVDVTCSMIPNGSGKRGITSKKAAIIGREWNLDPAANGMGTLTLYFPREVSSGYAPSGHVTSQSNVSGNTWDLHFNGSDDLNVRMSESLDGIVTKHFAVGDKVLIVQRDSGLIPLNVKGVVANQNAGTLRVTFETTWTPGSDEWILEYQRDDGTLPAHQTGFTYVANTLKQMHDGSVARRYV